MNHAGHNLIQLNAAMDSVYKVKIHICMQSAWKRYRKWRLWVYMAQCLLWSILDHNFHPADSWPGNNLETFCLVLNLFFHCCLADQYSILNLKFVITDQMSGLLSVMCSLSFKSSTVKWPTQESFTTGLIANIQNTVHINQAS